MVQLKSRLITRAAFLVLGGMAIAVNGAVANASAPLTCESIFESKGFPAGFGITSNDQARATRIPYVNALMTATQEAIVLLQRLDSVPNGALLALHPALQPPQVDRALEDLTLELRSFPTPFYNTYLASEKIDERAVRDRFDRLSALFSPREVSDDALVVLAFVSRKFPMAEPTDLRAQMKKNVADLSEKVILPFLAKADQAPHRLQSLPDFIDQYGLVLEFAALNRRQTLEEIGYHGPLKMTEEQYLGKVSEAINRSRKKLTLLERMQLAIDHFDPEIQQRYSDVGRVFAGLTAPMNELSNADKWKLFGTEFFIHCYYKFKEKWLRNAGPLDHVAGPERQKEFAQSIQQFVRSLTGLESSRANTLIAEAILLISQRETERVKAQFRPGKGELMVELNAVTAKIKELLTVHGNDEGGGQRLTNRASIGNTGIRDEAQVPGALNLANVIRSTVDTNSRYPFRAVRRNDQADTSSAENIQYVVFDKGVLSDFDKYKQEDLRAWVRRFMAGPTSREGTNGLKILWSNKNGTEVLWEIKPGDHHYRIMVVQNKNDKTWRWLRILHKDAVDAFIEQYKHKMN